jgi:hypothetical protein
LLPVVFHQRLCQLTYLFNQRTQHVRLAGECSTCCRQLIGDHLHDQAIRTGQSHVCLAVRIYALTEVDAKTTLGAALNVMPVSVGA